MSNVLSVRKSGQNIAEDVFEREVTGDAVAASRLVILIHGYRTDEENAADAYETFTQHLEAAMRPSERGVTAVWQFHWPGDHPNPAATLDTYDQKVALAGRAGGDLLAGLWLNERNAERQRIVLVGHSLGCRAVLHALSWIRNPRRRYEGAAVDGAFLLGAAVPVPICDWGADFGPSADDPLTHVFYSRRDLVLATVFLAGEYMAGEGGPAVGREGEPVGRWQGRHDTHLGHGDYWTSAEVADRVAAALGISTERHPADRHLLEWLPFERRPGRVRRFRDRRLRKRTVG